MKLSVLPACFVIALLVPVAAAQDSAPKTQVYVSGFPDAPLALTSNGTAEQALKVTLYAANFGCVSGGVIPVAITATGAPPGVTVTLDKAMLNFTAAQGVYTESVPVAPPYNASQEVKVSVGVGQIAANASVAITVTAAYDGAMPEGCQASGGLPRAEGSGVISLTLTAPPPPPAPEPVIEEKGFLPLPAVPGVLATLALAAHFSRRRQA